MTILFPKDGVLFYYAWLFGNFFKTYFVSFPDIVFIIKWQYRNSNLNSNVYQARPISYFWFTFSKNNQGWWQLSARLFLHTCTGALSFWLSHGVRCLYAPLARCLRGSAKQDQTTLKPSEFICELLHTGIDTQRNTHILPHNQFPHLGIIVWELEEDLVARCSVCVRMSLMAPPCISAICSFYRHQGSKWFL